MGPDHVANEEIRAGDKSTERKTRAGYLWKLIVQLATVECKLIPQILPKQRAFKPGRESLCLWPTMG